MTLPIRLKNISAKLTNSLENDELRFTICANCITGPQYKYFHMVSFLLSTAMYTLPDSESSLANLPLEMGLPIYNTVEYYNIKTHPSNTWKDCLVACLVDNKFVQLTPQQAKDYKGNYLIDLTLVVSYLGKSASKVCFKMTPTFVLIRGGLYTT